MGALTVPLCERASKVVSYEIDNELQPHLLGLGLKNLTLHFEDALEKPLSEIEKDFDGEYKLVANLPYYITSPVIMKLLSEQLPLKKIVVMVQKEAADRFCAEVGGKNSGAVTVGVNYYADARLLFPVPRESFIPSPKVDSAVIELTLLDGKRVTPKSEKVFFNTVKAAFSMRRKTAVNGLSGGLCISKEAAAAAIERAGLSPTVRAEKLSMEELSRLSDEIGKELK